MGQIDVKELFVFDWTVLKKKKNLKKQNKKFKYIVDAITSPLGMKLP